MRQCLKFIVLQTLVAMLTGCIYVPRAGRSSVLMPRIKEEAVRSLEPGTTTRDDVLHLFGTPHFTVAVKEDIPGLPGAPPATWVTKSNEPILYGQHRNDQDPIYGYKWYVEQGYFWVPTVLETEPIAQARYLCIEFSPNNRLKRFEVIKDSYFSLDSADKQVTDLLLEWIKQK